MLMLPSESKEYGNFIFIATIFILGGLQRELDFAAKFFIYGLDQKLSSCKD